MAYRPMDLSFRADSGALGSLSYYFTFLFFVLVSFSFFRRVGSSWLYSASSVPLLLVVPGQRRSPHSHSLFATGARSKKLKGIVLLPCLPFLRYSPLAWWSGRSRPQTRSIRSLPDVYLVRILAGTRVCTLPVFVLGIAAPFRVSTRATSPPGTHPPFLLGSAFDFLLLPVWPSVPARYRCRDRVRPSRLSSAILP